MLKRKVDVHVFRMIFKSLFFQVQHLWIKIDMVILLGRKNNPFVNEIKTAAIGTKSRVYRFIHTNNLKANVCTWARAFRSRLRVTIVDSEVEWVYTDSV